MTSLQVTHNWTPQLIAKDRELKEKYGSAAHVTPMSSYAGLERTPETEIMSFGKSNAEKTNSVSKKNLLIGTGLLLAAATGIAAYILTKGKKKPANISGNVVRELQEAAGTQTAKKFENIVKEFKKHNPEIADIEPIVTKLKNGKQKLEFKYVDKVNNNINEMLILDKSGNFEKRISFQKYGDMSNYVVRDGLGYPSATNFLKSKETATNGNTRDIILQKPGGWQNHIEVKSNDNAAVVVNHGWRIPFKKAQKEAMSTMIYKNNGAPSDVRQTIMRRNDDGNRVDKRFVYKAGQPKTEVEQFTRNTLSKQQTDAMAELLDF